MKSTNMIWFAILSLQLPKEQTVIIDILVKQVALFDTFWMQIANMCP